MEIVNTWIAVAVGVITVLAGMAAMLRSVVHALDRRIDGRITSRLDAQLRPMEQRLTEQIDSGDKALGERIDNMGTTLTERIDSGDKALGERIDNMGTTLTERIDGVEKTLGGRVDTLGQRMDRFDTKLDHITEVVDLRLKPLEEDMALIKRHILGLPAA